MDIPYICLFGTTSTPEYNAGRLYSADIVVPYGCFQNLGVLVVGVLVIRALLLRSILRPPILRQNGAHRADPTRTKGPHNKGHSKTGRRKDLRASGPGRSGHLSH